MLTSPGASPKYLILTGLLVFGLALWPRVWDLGRFLTPDEPLWAARSRDFLGGLIESGFTCAEKKENRGEFILEAGQGLLCTARVAHPGVMTMWSGSLGLWLYYITSGQAGSLLKFLSTLPLDPLDKALIPWLRLPVAVASAVSVALFFWGLARLLAQDKKGYWIALLAALGLALSPFEIALSRVLHTDALETIFMTLSLLAAFHYWINGTSRRWLIASGGLAGMAFIAKTPALFLLPFMGLLGLWSWGKVARPKQNLAIFFRLAGEGSLWFISALLVVFLLWPALWVKPLTILNYVFSVSLGYANEGHVGGNYFLGAHVDDPGPFFYPLNWLLHATPLVCLGVLAALVLWPVNRPGDKPGRGAKMRQLLGYDSPREALLFLSLLFVLVFTLFLSFSAKKQDRYLLPVYPFLTIVAALGWVSLGEKLEQWRQVRWLQGVFFSLLVAGGLGVNALLILQSFPYYFTYYNPLLGGLETAQQVTTVGWGEGLDLAAAYFNAKPEAKSLKVASWYGPTFEPFFVGATLDYSQQKGTVLGSDYVVIYLNQRQRSLPDEAFFRFFNARFKPEAVIPIQGSPYIWIYPSLGLDHPLTYERYEDLAALLGWEYTTPGIDPDHPLLAPGDSLTFELWWEYLGKPPQEALFFWLVGQDSQVWAAATARPKAEAGEPTTWTQGELIPETGVLTIPPGTPPGDYTIYIGFYPEGEEHPDNILLFGLGDSPRTITIKKGRVGVAAALMEPVEVEVDSLRLLGYHPDLAEMRPGESFELDLYWQAQAGLEARYQVSLALTDESSGQVRWEWEKQEPVTFYPTSNWEAGELVRSQLGVKPTVRTPGGSYQLALRLYQADELVKTIPLTSVSIPGRERQFVMPEIREPAEALFERQIRLLGFSGVEQRRYQAGERLEVQLFWQPQAAIEADYTVFVQLVGPEGQVYGQMDSQPLGGAAPTSQWTPGEVIQDRYTFAIAEATPPGQYRLIAGLYHFETGERLKLAGSSDDFASLTTVEVK